MPKKFYEINPYCHFDINLPKSGCSLQIKKFIVLALKVTDPKLSFLLLTMLRYKLDRLSLSHFNQASLIWERKARTYLSGAHYGA